MVSRKLIHHQDFEPSLWVKRHELTLPKKEPFRNFNLFFKNFSKTYRNYLFQSFISYFSSFWQLYPLLIEINRHHRLQVACVQVKNNKNHKIFQKISNFYKFLLFISEWNFDCIETGETSTTTTFSKTSGTPTPY